MCYSDSQIVAHRAGRFLVPRLVPFEPDRNSSPIKIRDDAVYLLAGGLGSLGFEICGTIAAQAKVHLVLLGRGHLPTSHYGITSSSSTRTKSEVPRRFAAQLRLEKTGASVWPIACDIGNSGELEAVVQRVLDRHGHIAGVVHAAGHLEDGVLWSRSDAQLNAVLRPKVLGSWNLHQVTAKLPLDLFVLFSSLSSLTGGTGHATYAAANAFQDALAHHRRRHGLPAVSINWGPWAESAAVQDRRYLDLLDAGGIRPLTSRQSVAAFNEILRTNPIQVAVFDDRSENTEDKRWCQCIASVKRQSESLIAALAPEFRLLDGLGPVLDQLCVFYVERAFAKANVFARAGETRTLDELATALRMQSKYLRLLPHLVAMLVEDGRWKRRMNPIVGCAVLLIHDVSSSIDRLADRFPSFAAQLRLLDRCAKHLADILAGTRNPLESLFPGGNVADAARLYEDSPATKYMGQLTAKALTELVEGDSFPPSARSRNRCWHGWYDGSFAL